MEQKKIALLGLGLMGSGMAGRLLAAGYPLTVYNRTREKVQPLVEQGARLATSPAEAAASAEIVFSMVSDDNVSRQVWLGESGALAGAAPKTILVESSTLSPGWIAELNSAAHKKGLELIDAPVTGSKPQAAAGQLLFLAGGSEAAIALLSPVLLAMGRGVVHLGPSGSGARMKLINNFMSGVQAASLAEAMGLIERGGLDVTQALGVLAAGAPGSPLVKTLSARMVARDFAPNFTAKLMAKDIRYALELGKAQSQDLPTATGALRDLEAAIAAGRGDEDFSVIVEQYRKR